MGRINYIPIISDITKSAEEATDGVATDGVETEEAIGEGGDMAVRAGDTKNFLFTDFILLKNFKIGHTVHVILYECMCNTILCIKIVIRFKNLVENMSFYLSIFIDIKWAAIQTAALASLGRPLTEISFVFKI